MSRARSAKDTDYLALSMRIHAMERRLLTRERMDRMIDAKDLPEAAKVLSECGYGELREVTPSALEDTLAQAQAELFRDLGGAGADRALLDVFRCHNDYHNAKVLVKAETLGVDRDRLLLPGGRYDPEKLAEDYRRGDLRACSQTFQDSVAQARASLGASGDPQLADFILDRACFEELTQLAAQTGSPFLKGFVALRIDAANLRAAVRAARLGKGPDFLRQVLAQGGSVPVRAVAEAQGEKVAGLFRAGPLRAAAELGAALTAPESGALTEFERACDDALMDYLSDGRRVAFGEQPIVGYLHARQAEQTAIRIILSGRMAGLDGETIRQRLRRTYT